MTNPYNPADALAAAPYADADALAMRPYADADALSMKLYNPILAAAQLDPRVARIILGKPPIVGEPTAPLAEPASQAVPPGERGGSPHPDSILGIVARVEALIRKVKDP